MRVPRLPSGSWPLPRKPRASRSSCRAATRRSRKATATRPCRPTSRRCPAGSATSVVSLDALIVATVPDVHKAVKWNSPFYGVEGEGWFLNFHCFTKYVKVAFFRGASLDPVPPGGSQAARRRYLDIREGDELDEATVRRLGRAGQQASRRQDVSVVINRSRRKLAGLEQVIEAGVVEDRHAELLGLGELAGARDSPDDDGERLRADAAGALAAAVLDRRLGLLA